VQLQVPMQGCSCRPNHCMPADLINPILDGFSICMTSLLCCCIETAAAMTGTRNLMVQQTGQCSAGVVPHPMCYLRCSN